MLFMADFPTPNRGARLEADNGVGESIKESRTPILCGTDVELMTGTTNGWQLEEGGRIDAERRNIFRA